jgi:gliding motility-associated-like protein
VTIEPYEEMESLMIDSTLVCEGQEVSIFVEVLNGAEPYSYAWQGFDDTTSVITVTVDSTAYYVVEITDYCGNILMDSIKMVVADGPDIDLGDDLLVCYGEEVDISAGSGFSSYLWQDGSQDSVYVATSPGWFWVTVTDFMGCVNTDSIFIEYYAEVQPELGNDTVLCEVDEILLDAGSGWQSYLWYNGATTQTVQVNEPGLYWVTVEDNNGCTGSDTIEVALSPAVLVTLGGDTTICSGDNYVLNPGAGFTSYLWQDGSNGATLPVNSPGTYWVNVTDVYGCSGSDTVIIAINPSPTVNLGNDTTICTGDVLVLEPGSQYTSYLWQDNSSLPIYSVSSTGLYSLTVTNTFNCTAFDEVFVEVTSPDIKLGPDTILCIGDTITLDPGEGYEIYTWQDNSTLPVFTVTTGGTYSVIVTDNYNCDSEESITIAAVEKPAVNLGGDQVLCMGETLVLETADGPFNFLWNGQPGSHQMEINEGGTYEVSVTNECGTDNEVVEVTEVPIPAIDLGTDQVLQPGESIQLDAGSGFIEYTWQDGSAAQYFDVNSEVIDDGSAFFWVEVWDGQCKNSDTILVEVFRVKVPNVITPNGDGRNDTFTPMDDNWSGISRHHIEVYNRWGEKIWESDDFESGWDGKNNGRQVAEGTYFWLLDVFYGPEDIKRTFKGTVTVLTGGS